MKTGRKMKKTLNIILALAATGMFNAAYAESEIKLTDAAVASGGHLMLPADFPMDCPAPSAELLEIDEVPMPVGLTTKSIIGKGTQTSVALESAMPLSGEGTESSPYLISSATDWNALAGYMAENTATLSGKYVQLTADIDFTSDTILPLAYDGITVFDGTLNGAGFTVKGFNATATGEDYGPVIMTTGENACIYDLNAEGTLTTGYSYSGGIVGGLYGKMSNVTGNVTIDGTAQYCTAGLIGYAGSTAQITGCVNMADVTASGSYVGGVVGYAYGCTITGCSNSGTFSTAAAHSGGVVGYAGLATITGCCLNGSATLSGNYSGGVVGYAYKSTVDSCVNKGYVTTVAEHCVGGVVGTAEGSTITACSNDSVVRGSSLYLGGVVGYAKYGTTISGCTNTGTVTTTAHYGGGVAGYVYQDCVVTGCANYGTLNNSVGSNTSEGYGMGGVACFVYGSTMTDCTNYGTVDISTNSCAAGVVAYLNSSTASNLVNDSTGYVSCTQYAGGVACYMHNTTLTDAVNLGEVVGTYYYAGGVVGQSQYSTLTRCANRGTLLGYYYVGGGVVGYAYLYSNLVDCTNEGYALFYSTDCYYCGGVVGSTYAVTMTNCYNDGIVQTYGAYGGGVVGLSGIESTYNNCGNRSTIYCYRGTVGIYMGGFAGFSYYGTFNDCFNTGEFSANGSGRLAGLIAYVAFDEDYTDCALCLNRCYNTVDIYSYYVTAGLLGTVSGGSYANLVMTDCYNTGDITSYITTTDDSVVYPTAGLACYYCQNSTFKGCWNSGDVTSNGYGIVGGLFGTKASTVTASEANRGYISGCYNTGKVTSASRYAGGIVGYVLEYTTVDSCYNTAEVEAGTYGAGGIAGSSYGLGTSTISNCWNAGQVTTGAAYAGGIVGDGLSPDAISCCFNVGDVESTSSSTATGTSGGGGIGGIVGYSSLSLTDVYSAGTVKGAICTGGLVGCPVAGKTSIERGYFMGTVDGNGGNIIGASTSNSNYWTDGNSMSGTYYLSANAVTCTDTASVGLSYAELAKLDLGDNWTAGDDYTYPRLTSLADNDYARAYAAAVVPADGDSYSSITTGFSVGAPDGVTWAASSGPVEIDGNYVTFTESYSGTLTMTASSGDVSVSTELTCINAVGGVSKVNAGRGDAVSETVYTTYGQLAAQPLDTKAVYIIVRTYSDGTTTATKEIR